MKTLHNTKNCNYRRFLHKKLKHGKISGKFYKFLDYKEDTYLEDTPTLDIDCDYWTDGARS